MTTIDGHPVQLDVAYPDRPLNRLTSAFRIVAIIPIAIVLGAVSGATWTTSTRTTTTVTAGAGGVLFAAPLLMILFRQKYPRWWFDWNLELTRFSARVALYAALLDDRYPSTDEAQSLRLDIPYPDARADLNRWLPLVKWLLAIPHYIVLAFLGIAALVCVVIAWFAILLHRPLPAHALRLRRRSGTLGRARTGLRVPARHGSLPALQAEPVGGHGLAEPARYPSPSGSRARRMSSRARVPGRNGAPSAARRRRCSSPTASVPSACTTLHHGTSSPAPRSAVPVKRGAPGERSP